jgi:hypothetical protein
MKLIGLLFLLAVLSVLAHVRFAPIDAARWHLDPLNAKPPGSAGYSLLPPDAPVFDAAPADVMDAIVAVVSTRNRVQRLDGDPAAGHISFVARSKFLAFPDIISIRVLPTANSQSTVAILARARFGGYDWDVNQKRVEAWLGAVEDRLGS